MPIIKDGYGLPHFHPFVYNYLILSKYLGVRGKYSRLKVLLFNTEGKSALLLECY